MRLSKIKLAGFKSFVDPTTIKFPSNLMGIVGPNGCGKSNIIDAIRWVLGESSAKTLRGDSMADVIFNGSSGRKPVGQASIELVFDNSDGTVGGAYAGYAEVAIRRVVTRDGASQYYLNNSKCRRKDITHILLGTGLGSHGYSIIEQGMISRLIEARPEELRAFLEEAAGISKYKERRRETEHRISHTRDNLARLQDLRDEVEKQLAHLQRQARDATRYKELKAEQRRIEAELLGLRLQSLKSELRQAESLQTAKQVAMDAAMAEQRALESQLERCRVELAERNDRFGIVQGSYYKASSEIARLEQAIQHRKELCRRQAEELDAADAQLSEISVHIENDELELGELERVLAELAPELEQTQREQQNADLDLRDAEQAVEQWRGAFEAIAHEMAQTERLRHVEEARSEELLAQSVRIERTREKLSTELGALDSAELERTLEKLVANEETLKAGCADATRALDSVWQQIQHLRDQDGRIATHLDKLRGQMQNDRGRLASLQALQEAALGKADKRVSDWLGTRNLQGAPLLAQELVVAQGWERAVETVLGGYLEAVTVDGLDALAEAFAELLAAGGGLSLLESADAPLPAVAPNGLLHHVQGPPVLAHLLAGIRVSESLADALAMRRTLSAGESVVTRDGFWIGTHWLRINRKDDPRVGVIARSDEIKRLTADVANGARRIEEIEKALLDTRRRLEQLEESRAKAQAEAGRRQQLYAETRSRLEGCRLGLTQMRERRESIDKDLSELNADQYTLTSARAESQARLNGAADGLVQLAGRREVLEGQRDITQQRLLAARERAEGLRRQAQETALRVESRRSSKESAAAALARIRTQQQHLQRRRGELRTQLDAAVEPLSADEAALVQKLEEQLAVEQALAAARTALETIDTELREIEQRRAERERVVNEAREQVGSARLAVRESQVRMEAIADQFAKTEFALETIQAELPADATVEVWTESYERLERRIQRLGAINLAAIDEFREQSERKEYLDAQFKDLTEALDTLEGAIRRIDKETRTRFKETFDKTNQGLGRLFPRLFGGGHAYLELDGDDLLSSGVTVMARPPGKRNSTIHLLSGGEKALTAVSLVFSIFELNPAPFCLLDEVDAPLDDANVGRFSELVKEMSQQVQFVLITHNKSTMEVMHQLTGVTMHEPGVSRMVAVDIDEAVRLAAM